MVTIRIEARNNSDARNTGLWSRSLPRTASARHNGGKIVVATCRESDLDAVKETLESMHEVRSYEVES